MSVQKYSQRYASPHINDFFNDLSKYSYRVQRFAGSQQCVSGGHIGKITITISARRRMYGFLHMLSKHLT